MRPPAFWADAPGSWPARVLTPLGWITATIAARRLRRPCFRAPVPVICCGNATLGGAGKTLVALDLAERLRADAGNVHLLLRGYGGRASGPRLVRPGDPPALVGDEALLLAAVAPTWIGADRAASAHAAVADGAEILVMDDGLQNPTLCKNLSLLVIDGGAGFGNGLVFPSGPLREPVGVAASRCQAAVIIGEDRRGAARLLPPALPILTATLVPGPEVAALAGRKAVAFAGIARPDKFFAMLREARVELLDAIPFPDHHPFRAAELARLLAKSEKAGAPLLTTAKDAVRIPSEIRLRVTVATVSLAWTQPDALAAMLGEIVTASCKGEAEQPFLAQ